MHMCMCKGEFISAAEGYASVLLLAQLVWGLVLHIHATPVRVHPSLGCRFGAPLAVPSLCRLSVIISVFTCFKPQLLGQVGVLSCW